MWPLAPSPVKKSANLKMCGQIAVDAVVINFNKSKTYWRMLREGMMLKLWPRELRYWSSSRDSVMVEERFNPPLRSLLPVLSASDISVSFPLALDEVVVVDDDDSFLTP